MAKATYKIYTQIQTDGKAFGVVPHLPGCRLEGRHLIQLLSNAKQDIEGHLTALAKAGKRIPIEPFSDAETWDIEVDLPTGRSSRTLKSKRK